MGNVNVHNMKKLIVILFAFVILGCHHKNMYQHRSCNFRPIVNNGQIYAYISAKSYGIAGNHDRIMVQIDTNNLDTNYYFYTNELYYKVSNDWLEIVVGDFAVKKNTIFDIKEINVKIIDQFEYSNFKNNYKNMGYTLVSTYE